MSVSTSASASSVSRDLFSLANKTALVTGATGDIGAAIAKTLHRAGATVVVSGTRVAKLEALAEALGERCFAIPADLSDPASPEHLRTQIEAHVPEGVDILVNNAGIARDGLLIRTKIQDWEQVLDVNLKAVFSLTQAFARSMARKRYGRVINMGSVVGTTGNRAQAAYVASKAGLVGFTKSVALELAGRGVTANVIAPGFIKTAMTAPLPPVLVEKFMDATPLGRPGHVDEIAAAALFLASEEAGFITGQTLHVNGGMVMP